MRKTIGTVQRAVALTASPADGLVDEPLSIRLGGMPAGARVTLQACMREMDGTRWTSRAEYLARVDGTIDVSTDAPQSGTYAGVDGEGLIASMAPEGAMAPRPFDSNSTQPLIIDIAATIHGHNVATVRISRRYVAAGVQAVAVRDRGLAGVLFRPPTSEARPAVLVLGGSEGGLRFAGQTAALLASHGMVSLALPYFAFEDLPKQLVDIPLEYFETALQWLSAQPGARPDALAVLGRSRGAELALILGSRLPSVRSIVAYCPSSIVWNGLRGDRVSESPAWTACGRAIPFASLAALTSPQLRAEIFGLSRRTMMLWRSMAAGVLATVSLDVLSVMASRLQLSAPLPPHLIGRWFAFIARGQLCHVDIAHAPGVSHEMAIALPVHYAIGIALTGVYVWSSTYTGRSPRSLGLALAFGLCTNVLPWLLMFPAMGYGFFGSHGPEGTRLFVSSLLNHAFFGVGIWLGVMAAGLR